MLPNTILGLVFLIAFLGPGFVVVLETRRRLSPQFAARISQIEFVSWICLGGLASHMCLLLLHLLICSAWVVASDQVTLSSCLTKTIGEIFPKDVQNLKIQQLLYGLAYIIVVFPIAMVSGALLARILRSRGFGTMEYRAAWQEAFSTDYRNFVLAFLDNGYVVTGLAEHIQADPDSFITGDHDIVLSSPDVYNLDGSRHPRIAEIITINTRNIKILEIANPDREEGEYDV